MGLLRSINGQLKTALWRASDVISHEVEARNAHDNAMRTEMSEGQECGRMRKGAVTGMSWGECQVV